MKWYTVVALWLLMIACVYGTYVCMVSDAIKLWGFGEWGGRLIAIPVFIIFGRMIVMLAKQTIAEMLRIAGGIMLWRQNRTKRNPPIFLSTSESPPQRKLLPPSEQTLDQPEDIKSLQDGQQQDLP